MPDQESEHAYVRRADGVTYVCPWQTRLRCLLSYGRMLSTAGSALPGVIPDHDDHETMTALARLAEEGLPGPATRLHILASVWTVPLAWFVPFAADRAVAGPRTGRQAAVRPANRVRDPGAAVYHTDVPGPQAGGSRPGGAARPAARLRRRRVGSRRGPRPN